MDESAQSLKGSGYKLDAGLSSDDTQVIVNPDTKEVVLVYRYTQLNSKKNKWKDLASDLEIATDMEKFNPHFRKASKYVNDQNKGKVHKNIAFS